MGSDHTTILVVGLTLGLLLLIVLAVLLLAVVGYRNLQLKLSFSKFSEHALEQDLAKYTEAGKKKLPVKFDHAADYELKNAAFKYWFHLDDLHLRTRDCPDTVDRIENFIFPKSRLLPRTRGEDFTIFPNPHHYTAAEIFKLFQNHNTRGLIMTHIMASVLEKYIMLTPVGDVCVYSLLPFAATDIQDLYHLRVRLRGANFIGSLSGHIDHWPPNNQIHHAPGNPERQFIRDFFEELFGPYYAECAPEQIAERNRKIEEIMDRAVDFGYQAACFVGETVHDWGERQEGHTTAYPTLKYMDYLRGKWLTLLTFNEAKVYPWGL